MKILEIIASLKTAGAERFVVELSNELATCPGIEVQILQLMPVTEKDICAESLHEGICRTSLNKGRGFSFKAMVGVYKYIRKHHITHVHAHGSAISYVLLPALLCRGVRFFATIHSDARLDAGNKFLITLIRKILFKCGLCVPVTISEESNKSFRSFYGMEAPIIFNGISAKAARQRVSPFQEKGLHFVHVARVSEQKNQILLYQAFQRLVDSGGEAWLYHYGRFGDDEISQRLRALSNEHIKIMGEIPEATDVLRFADAMCLSSMMEGMPMTIIESFSVGSPVICTPVGGCVNMINDGVNGILSEDCTVDKYYKALERFSRLSGDEKEQMRKNALLSFKRYDIRDTAKSYLAIFNS